MNIIKLTISLILIISTYSDYEDCTQFQSELTIKNYLDYTSGTPKYIDKKKDKNFTYIAENADSCKKRTIRAYEEISGGDLYDSAKEYERKKTLKTHCCYMTYDNMGDFEMNILEYNETEYSKVLKAD